MQSLITFKSIDPKTLAFGSAEDGATVVLSSIFLGALPNLLLPPRQSEAHEAAQRGEAAAFVSRRHVLITHFPSLHLSLSLSLYFQSQ